MTHETNTGAHPSRGGCDRKPETPEHRARQTYELLISDPHRPGALQTLTEAFRSCENDALERAANAAYSHPAYCQGYDSTDEEGLLRPGSPYDRGRYEARAAIRALKHKEPT